MSRHAQIVGIGSYLPEHRLTNKDLERLVDTSDEWIVSRTGIQERRIVADGEATSHLAARAARGALDDSGVPDPEVDMLVVGTSSPDMVFPSTACLTQRLLGLSCPAFDVMAACTGFIYAIQVGTAAIESGRADTVLVVGADALTRHVDFTDRATCVLFGDGAGAVVLRSSDTPGILGIALGADGSGASMLSIPVGGSAAPATCERVEAREHYLDMNGNEVFKFAVRVIPKVTREALQACGRRIEDLAWLVPHQANQRIIHTVAERLELPHSRVFSNIATTGNTSAASIPLAMDDLYTSGRLSPDDLVALVGFGAGLTWGAVILSWTKSTPTAEV